MPNSIVDPNASLVGNVIVGSYLPCFFFFFFCNNAPFKYFLLFAIAIAAAEAAIGPAIVSSIYRNRKSTRINQSNLLNK